MSCKYIFKNNEGIRKGNQKGMFLKNSVLNERS